MTAHQAGGDLQVLLLGRLAGPDEPPDADRVRGETLFHEHVHALLHRVFQMDRAERGVRRQQSNVARTQAVDRLAVGVETHELPVGGHVNRRPELAGRPAARAVDARLEQIGHGHELGIAVGHCQRVGRGPAAAPAAADQGQANRVVLPGMDVRNRHLCQGRARSQLPTPRHELSP